MKTAYEVVALPLTNFLVSRVEKIENTDILDLNISYNPLKISDL